VTASILEALLAAVREGEPVALAEFAQGELRPFRVFNF